jgi:hypothetical protein
MRLPRLFSGVLAAAIAGSALVGCSLANGDDLRSEGGSAARDPLDGSGQAVRDQAAVKPAGSVLSASTATGGLLIELPEGFSLSFEPVAGANADEQAVLTDSAVLFAAWYQAIGRGDVDDSLYGSYANARVRAALREVVAMFRANGWTVTGSVLVNRRSVRLTGNSAHVAWCADLRKAFPKESSSGHVLRSAIGDQSFLHFSATMRRNDAGIWVATSLKSRRAAPACLPS